MHQRAITDTGRTVWWARLAGVVSGVAGLAVADLTAWVVSPAGAPVAAVGEVVIEVLPGPLVNFGKEVLGFADKPILTAIVVVVVLAVAGLGGQLEQRRRFAGIAVFAGLAVLGLVGVNLRGSDPVRDSLPTVVGLLVGYLILDALVTRLVRWSPGEAAPTQSRRRFLRLTALVGATAVVASLAGRVLAGGAAAVRDARSRVRLPGPAGSPAPVPSGASLPVDGLTPYVTPNADFYRIDTALQVPVINPDDWSLKVTGMVAREVTISYAELLAKPLVEHLVTLTCVSNEVGGDLAGNASWLGYPVRDLLAEARPEPGADMVLSTSDDGWTAGTPLAALTDPGRQALLAVGMNGEPLPVEHGFPVRMVVPGLYGYVSATKWVTELKVTTFAADQGYWTPLGWSAMGPIKIASRIDVPGGPGLQRRTVDAGSVVVAGVAWAQHTGIAGVEVQVDGGPWQPAELAETAGVDTWRQWRLVWPAAPGRHTLKVRATDASGQVQTDAVAAPAPDGATGHHTVDVRVR